MRASSNAINCIRLSDCAGTANKYYSKCLCVSVSQLYVYFYNFVTFFVINTINVLHKSWLYWREYAT